MQVTRIVAIVGVLVGLALAQEAATRYTVNPSATNAPNLALTPTCDPLVISKGAAFLSYVNTSDETPYVQFVDPTKSTTLYPSRLSSKKGVLFTRTPISVGKEDFAIAYTSDTDESKWALLGRNGAMFVALRQGSTADIAYSSTTMTAFVPVGSFARAGSEDSIEAISFAADGATTLQWRAKFTLPAGFNGRTAMQNPTAYDGALYMIQDDTMYALKTEKDTTLPNQILWSVKNPCGIVPAQGYFIQMKLVTLGKDANGPLDALILYANVTTLGGEGFAMCRISLQSHQSEWAHGSHITLAKSIEVHNIVGGKEVVFVSGRFANVPDYKESFTIVALSAITGDMLYTVPRSPADMNSHPAMLPIALTGCNTAFAAQVDGKLTAYCTESGPSGGAKWTSSLGCAQTPIVMNLTNYTAIGCNDLMSTVHAVNANDGTVKWSNPIKSAFSPTYSDGILWAVDIHATLHGLDPSSIIPPAPTGGLTQKQCTSSTCTSGCQSHTFPLDVCLRLEGGGSAKVTKCESSGLTMEAYPLSADCSGLSKVSNQAVNQCVKDESGTYLENECSSSVSAFQGKTLRKQ